MKAIRKLSLLIVCFVLALLAVFPVLAQTTGEVELVGEVQAMTLDTITVNGQVIAVAVAEINTPLEIGAIVKIEGTLDSTGAIVAREVNPVAAGVQPGEAELVGILESFSGTTMVINGQTIEVSGAEIEAGLVVGELVKIHATASEGNTWVAREVESFVPDEEESDDSSDDNMPGDDDGFEISGTLEEIGDGFIVISGQTIAVTDAEIKDLLVVGVLVKVHVRTVEGALVAREVENASEDDDNTNMNDNTDDNQNANGSVETAVSAQDAINRVIEVYPNTTVIEIELEDKFGGTLVWDIKTSHGIELTIDAQTGAILTIDRDDDNSNANLNSNDNSDDDHNNANLNSNDDDHDDDKSGKGSDDDHEDDNSGKGSDDNDDDDDDNSGMGSDDD